jgi:hypothetical protein
MSTAPGDVSNAGDVRAAEISGLKRKLVALSIVLCVIIAAAVVGAIFMVDEPRTDDMRKLALLAALGGLAGGATRSLLAIAEGVGFGYELSDGTHVLRGMAANLYARDVRQWEEDLERHERREAKHADPEPYGRPRPDPNDAIPTGFSVSDIPGIVVSPLVGAVLGVIVFAGVVGGFLVASTSEGTYSAPALLFLAFLGGIFSSKFFQRLAAAADALLGVQDTSRSPDVADTPARGAQQQQGEPR